MGYDEALAERVRGLLPGTREQSMFGGLGFLTAGGHMAVCVSGQGRLLVRVTPDEGSTLVGTDGVEPMVMGGRDSRTWMIVGPERLSRDGLETWVGRGEAVADSLPPK